MEDVSYFDRIKIYYNIRREDELASTIVNLIGFGLNTVGMILLIVFSALKGNPVQIVSFSIYGAFQIIYCIFSTLYHSFQETRIKKIFRVFELSSNYLMLIGIAIPLSLVALGGRLGWLFFYLFILLNSVLIVNTILQKHYYQYINYIFNFLSFITYVVFLVIAYRYFTQAFIIWLGFATLAFLLGLILKEFKGFPFYHAMSHLFYITANVMLFFGFLFELVL